MDVLGQVLRSIIGDHPPNGWTALIACTLCVAYVATQWIRARHHADQRRFIAQATPEQVAALVVHHKTPKPPASGGVPLAIVLFFAAALLFRLGGLLAHVPPPPAPRGDAIASSDSAKPEPNPPKEDAKSQEKDCNKTNCPPPAMCVHGKCQNNAKDKVASCPLDSSLSRDNWRDSSFDPADDRWRMTLQ